MKKPLAAALLLALLLTACGGEAAQPTEAPATVASTTPTTAAPETTITVYAHKVGDIHISPCSPANNMDTIIITEGVDNARRAELIADYLAERQLLKDAPDQVVSGHGVLTVEIYSDTVQGVSAFAICEGSTVCTTLREDNLTALGALTWDARGDARLTLDCPEETVFPYALAWLAEVEPNWAHEDCYQLTYSHDSDGFEQLDFCCREMGQKHGNWASSGIVTYDALGRAVLCYYYVTHGSHWCNYLYEGDALLPWAVVDICPRPYSGTDDGAMEYGNDVTIFLLRPA